jgi:hypothetical protein
VIGLSLFALLLQQITLLHDTLNQTMREHLDAKDDVVRFMSYNKMPSEIMQKTMKFLEASKENRLKMQASRDHWLTLPESLQREAMEAMCGPVSFVSPAYMNGCHCH